MDFSSSLALARSINPISPGTAAGAAGPKPGVKKLQPSPNRPHLLLAPCGWTKSTKNTDFTQEQNPRRAQKRGPAATRPALRNCCSNSLTQTLASKLWPARAPRAAAGDTDLSASQCASRRHCSAGTKGRGGGALAGVEFKAGFWPQDQ